MPARRRSCKAASLRVCRAEDKETYLAYRFEFDVKNRIIRGQFSDKVNDAELVDFYRTAARICRALAPEAGITDLTGATSLVTSGTIRALAKLPPVMPQPDRPRFIVAASDEVYGLARMFQMAGEATRPNLHVIRSNEEAFATLGVDEPEFHAIARILRPAGSVPCGIWEERE